VPRVDLARTLAETMRTLRRDAGLTQQQLAKALGISRPTLTRIENADQNVTLKTLRQICRALGSDPGDLFKPGRVRLRVR